MKCAFEDCNENVYVKHCKIICEEHGVIADCSDPFRF